MTIITDIFMNFMGIIL